MKLHQFQMHRKRPQKVSFTNGRFKNQLRRLIPIRLVKVLTIHTSTLRPQHVLETTTKLQSKRLQYLNTLDVVDKAGRDKETAYVKVLKGIEQRRDIEKSLFKNEARSASEPRKAAKLITWITNVSAPSDMAAATGDGSDVADLTGTAEALTLAKIDAAMLAAYNDGGAPNMLLMSPTNKQNFSGLSSGSVSTNQITYTAPREAAIIGSVSLYLSDFGELAVTVDRQCPNSEMYLIDTDYVCIGSLPGRMFSVSDVAPNRRRNQIRYRV